VLASTTARRRAFTASSRTTIFEARAASIRLDALYPWIFTRTA
jgi:hypothetical protein